MTPTKSDLNQNPSNQRNLVSVSDAARLTGAGKNTIFKWIKQERLVVRDIGFVRNLRTTMVDLDEVRELIGKYPRGRKFGWRKKRE